MNWQTFVAVVGLFTFITAYLAASVIVSDKIGTKFESISEDLAWLVKVVCGAALMLGVPFGFYAAVSA